MAIVSMKAMLAHAHQHRYAVGAFDLVDLHFLGGILDAAEACRAPVILSLAESHFEYFDFDLLMPAVVAAAERASVPVAIHLDHGQSVQSAVRAINAGCNGVMVDASHLPFEENARITKEVVRIAHGCGVPVEGELGYVPGVEGKDAELHPGKLVYTTPEEARRFVEQTGVDFLAVSIGTVHGRMRGRPKLDLDRLAAIDDALGIPLVIHGGTGLSEEQFRALIERGVAKINYYTALADAAGRSIAARLEEGARSAPEIVKRVRQAVAEEVKRCIELWGSAGKADAIFSVAEPWQPVEHIILYNLEGLDPDAVEEMMREGREVLATIPGVLAVDTGKAVREDARYRYCWRIRFAHPEVIASYRDHPTHRRFADTRFRPYAADRVSVDYELVRDLPRQKNED